MKLIHDYIQRKRTEGTILSILIKLKGIPTDELIADLFLHTEDEFATELVKKFEGILIKASMDLNYLNENLHDFYIETAKYLKENKMYNNFSKFAYFIYSNLSNNNVNLKILSAYQNLLLQQFCYLTPPGKIAYGITTDGKLMITDEIYPFLDYPIYEIEEKNIKNPNEIKKIFKSYGYSIETLMDYEKIFLNEQIVTNMIIEMTNFINEDTSDIVPDRFIIASKGISTIRKWKDTSFYKDLIKRRKYILPSSGVLGIYNNAGNIHSILLKEYFMDNQIYLLYKIINKDDEGFYGVYDIKNDFFYSLYKDSTGEEKYHSFIENFILENYCHLTTDIEIDKKRNMALQIVDNIEDNNFHYPYQPIVQFVYKDNKNYSSNKDAKTLKNYDKKKYKEETITINPYIRRLPDGAIASDEAIERAKDFGYELAKGETFVRPFKRKTYRLKD